MLSIYPAYFISDKQGVTVIFSDWNDTSSYGMRFDEAMEMAIDCLAGLIYAKRLDKEPLPKPSKISKKTLQRIAKEYECSEEKIEAHLVSVDAEQYAKVHFEKTIKKTITILDWQNKEGIRQGINFSKVCQEALTKVLRSNM